MFIIIVFWLGNDMPSRLIFLELLYFFPYSRLSSYLLLRLFLCLISLLLGKHWFGKTSGLGKPECLGKHWCMSSPIPITILNASSFLFSLLQENPNMPSGHYYRLCSWRGRSNHLIKKNSLLANVLAASKRCLLWFKISSLENFAIS